MCAESLLFLGVTIGYAPTPGSADDCSNQELCPENETKCDHTVTLVPPMGDDLNCDGYFCPEYITVEHDYKCISSTSEAEYCCWHMLCIKPKLVTQYYECDDTFCIPFGPPETEGIICDCWTCTRE